MKNLLGFFFLFYWGGVGERERERLGERNSKRFSGKCVGEVVRVMSSSELKGQSEG